MANNSVSTNSVYYLVDSENIGDGWVELVTVASKNDRILVFYTDKSIHISCAKARMLQECDPDLIEWIPCSAGTKNALDFQLVTQLGAIIPRHAASEYVIFSNDNGFDVVVDYWCKNGVRVSKEHKAAARQQTVPQAAQSTPKQIQQSAHLPPVPQITAAQQMAQSKPVVSAKAVKTVKAAKQTAKTVKLPKVKAAAKVKTAEPTSAAPKEETTAKKPQTKQAADRALNPTDVGLSSRTLSILSILGKSLPIEPSTLLNNALNLIFTPKDGAEIYNKLKQLPEYRQLLCKKLLQSRSDRVRNYIVLILTTNKLDAKCEHEIYEIVKKFPGTDANKIRSEFMQAFGNEKGQEYFKLIKRHLSIIKRI